MDIRAAIAAYSPFNEQEAADKELILDFLQKNPDAFYRTNRIAHMTASAWVVNPARDRVLMVYHNIYDSWSWTGGHADGEENLAAVALREVREETGVRWFTLDGALEASTEPWFVQRIYGKLNEKLRKAQLARERASFG